MSDVVVIGAGVNGLTAAAVLASEGLRVVVLEAREVVGGLAASEALHDGYHTGGLLHDTTRVRPAVVSQLALERHGLSLRGEPPKRLALGDGAPLMLGGSEKHELASIAERSGELAERYAAMNALLGRLRPVLTGFCDEMPLDLVNIETTPLWSLLERGLRVRRLGRSDMLELMRIAPMCIADFLDEHLLGEHVDDDRLKAAIALPGVLGTFTGPRSPGSNANLLLLHAMRGPGTVGGAHGFVAALKSAAEAAGAEIRTGATVERIDVRHGAVTGVTLEGGERVEARQIAASCDPRTALLDLVRPVHVTAKLEAYLSSWRCRGTTAHLALALAGEPPLDADHATVASSLDEIERAFDGVKYGELPDRPVLDVVVPSVEDPSLCPDGHAVMSVLVSFVPHGLKGGWTDEARQTLEDTVVARLAEHIDGLRDLIVGSRLVTPPDIESSLRLSGGHIHHGEHAIDQLLVRPVPGCATYSTPITGLFLCGAGTHPGGGLHGGNGLLAARAMAKHGP